MPLQIVMSERPQPGDEINSIDPENLHTDGTAALGMIAVLVDYEHTNRWKGGPSYPVILDRLMNTRQAALAQGEPPRPLLDYATNHRVWISKRRTPHATTCAQLARHTQAAPRAAIDPTQLDKLPPTPFSDGTSGSSTTNRILLIMLIEPWTTIIPSTADAGFARSHPHVCPAAILPYSICATLADWMKAIPYSSVLFNGNCACA